jgi:hypothetical protein
LAEVLYFKIFNLRSNSNYIIAKRQIQNGVIDALLMLWNNI